MNDAARWWGERRLIRWYEQDQPWRREVAEHVVGEHPQRVLEFGCNVGRNLADIRDLDAGIELVGVDINGGAVARGVGLYGLDLRHVEPDYLESVPGDAYDVAFTVSVLDHIPDPPLEDLVRIAPVLFLLEPWTGHEGPVEGARNPYTWSWDYPRRLRALGCSVAIRRLPISSEFTGPHYRLHTVRRRG